jgi:hypothetical protein
MVQLRKQDAIDSQGLIQLTIGAIYRVVDEIKSKLIVRAIERHDLLARECKSTSAPLGPEESGSKAIALSNEEKTWTSFQPQPEV